MTNNPQPQQPTNPQPLPCNPPPQPCNQPNQQNNPAIKVYGGCNCQKNRVCPIPGVCTTKCVLYRANVEQTSGPELGKVETYTGLTEGTFKQRYTAHMCTFELAHKRGDTSLAVHVWDLIHN